MPLQFNKAAARSQMLTQSSVLTSLNQLDLKNVMEHHYDKGIAIERIQIMPHNQFKIDFLSIICKRMLIRQSNVTKIEK